MATPSVNPIYTDTLLPKDISSSDSQFIESIQVDTVFDPNNGDYIEFYIYDLNNNIIQYDYNYNSYTSNNFVNNENGFLYSELTIDPANDVKIINKGKVNVIYNFYKNLLGSNYSQNYFITNISSDRTEIELKTTQIFADAVIETTNAFIKYFNETSYYPEFYVNFGANQVALAVNIKLIDTNPNDPSIYIKLYEPLSDKFNTKTPVWIVEQNSESQGFLVEFPTEKIPDFKGIPLSGPNTNLSIKDQINNSTDYTDYETLVYNTLSITGSYSQLKSLLEEKGYDINVDYSNFTNFINLSSAVYRLENFAYKMGLIEEYQFSASLSDTTVTNYYVSSSKDLYEQKIQDIITNFDGYEYFLYYTSGSEGWPKYAASAPPYTNYSVTSSQALTWLGSANPQNPYYGGMILSASNYDLENIDSLLYSIPEYLRNDPANENYELFIGMVGQHFDNIWIYLKDITNKYNADNRIDYGISKDLVSDAIKDFGVKLYQNNFSQFDLYSAFLGIDPEGNTMIFPNTTGSLPTPTGYEYIDNYITSSNGVYPMDDVQKRNYKRIYHNLPFLLKKKGTLDGLRTLINIYGIPNTILDISEFGGKDKDNSNDWDYWKNKFNYKFDTNNNGWVSTEWDLNPDWNSEDGVPSTLQFRFKTPDLNSGINTPNQTLWSTEGNSYITLEYTGSGYTSGSYSGSIADPYNQFATLKFTPDWQTSPSISASVYLPFFDGDWWSVSVTREGDTFTLYAGNNIYDGDDGSQIGFTGSSSIIADITPWISGNNSYFPSNNRQDVNNHTAFSGSYQEIRYFSVALSQSIFDDFVMNPYSIEGNGISGSYETLAFRASLGNELYTESISIHPKVTGSYITQSFSSDSNFTINNGEFSTNREYIYLDQFPAGIKNRISDKIKVVETQLPSSGSGLPTTSSLSQYISVQQNYGISGSYTEDVNYVEVAFSPTNQINDDIINQLGYFNLGDYIGDPRQIPSGSYTYPDLVSLSNYYFEKYKSNYDVYDFVRLIKFFDNSLFKMIKDFVPARANLASGIVVKQHLLERNKYTLPQVNISTSIAYVGNPTASEWNIPYGDKDISLTASIGSTPSMSYDQKEYNSTDWFQSDPLYTFTASEAGSMPEVAGSASNGWNFPTQSFEYFVNITQSWTGSRNTPSGIVEFTDYSQEEFIDGEFSGSLIIATTQSLNSDNPFLYPSTTETNYSASLFVSSLVNSSYFLSSMTPSAGEMYLLYDSSSL